MAAPAIIATVETFFLPPGATRSTANPPTINITQSDWVPTVAALANPLAGRKGKTMVPITITYTDNQQQQVGMKVLPIGTSAKLFRSPVDGDILNFEFDLVNNPVPNPEPAVQFGGKRRKSRRNQRVRRTMKVRRQRR